MKRCNLPQTQLIHLLRCIGARGLGKENSLSLNRGDGSGKSMLQVLDLYKKFSRTISEKNCYIIFQKWGGGVNGHLEFFRKFIRFGSLTRPLDWNVIRKPVVKRSEWDFRLQQWQHQNLDWLLQVLKTMRRLVISISIFNFLFLNPEIWSEWKDDPGFKSFVDIKVIITSLFWYWITQHTWYIWYIMPSNTIHYSSRIRISI